MNKKSKVGWIAWSILGALILGILILVIAPLLIFFGIVDTHSF